MTHAWPTSAIAGFWRRLGGFLVDWIVTGLLFQFVAITMFQVSAGQFSARPKLINFNDCQVTTAEAANRVLGGRLPEGANEFYACRSSFAGFESGRELRVSKFTKDGATYSRVTYTYPLFLDSAGFPRFDLTGGDYVLAFVYLIFSERLFGRTLGKWAFGVGVRDARALSTMGLALSTALARNMYLFLPFAPLILTGLALRFLPTGAFPPNWWIFAFVMAGLVAVAGQVWAVIAIAKGLDPFYDRWSGTTVVRTSRPQTSAPSPAPTV